MNATQTLQPGQSLWLDSITRTLLQSAALAARLQREGVDAFATSWHALLTRIREVCVSPALRV